VSVLSHPKRAATEAGLKWAGLGDKV